MKSPQEIARELSQQMYTDPGDQKGAEELMLEFYRVVYGGSKTCPAGHRDPRVNADCTYCADKI